MTRKISIGLFLTLISAIAAVVGVAFYMINTKTAYFSKLGVDSKIVLCLALAVVCELIIVVVGMKQTAAWTDVLSVVVNVLLVLGTIFFVSARVNGIAAVMTFENNAENMADLSSALTGMIACGVAVVSGWLAAFFDITKE